MLLGRSNEGDIGIDLPRLIETRLLLTANSGGGKTYAMRRILEQTHGKVQQIIIDVEDEFHTLREKFDYIIAGSGNADCPAHPGCAAALARKILELNVSAIVSIYELKPQERKHFVRLFLDAIMNADKRLWHSTLIVIDEADVFCPQIGDAESADSVKDLMSRGRKRGFCGILATQRISKLHKDAAAECNNKLIGRCALDVDMKRAGDELGLTDKGRDVLRWLAPGFFYCFGPALTPVPTQIKVLSVETSHPKAGQHASAPPPPREKVQKILAQLADLPRQAQEEAKTIAGLQARVRELERVKSIDVKGVNESYARGFNEAKAKLSAEIARLNRELDGACEAVRKAIYTLNAVPPIKSTPPDFTGAVVANVVVDERKMQKAAALVHKAQDIARSAVSFDGISAGEKKILVALAQHPDGLDFDAVRLVAGFSASGTFTSYLAKLRRDGLIVGGRENMKITDQGRDAVGEVPPLPTGSELFAYWLNWMGPSNGAGRILTALQKMYPEGYTKAELAEAIGGSVSGTFTSYLADLRKLGLIDYDRGVGEITLNKRLVD